jgi:hypothetical protein
MSSISMAVEFPAARHGSCTGGVASTELLHARMSADARANEIERELEAVETRLDEARAKLARQPR